MTTNPVSCSLWFPAAILRQKLDHILDRRVLASGQGLTWSEYDPPSDDTHYPAASPHITVDYVDSTPSTRVSAWCCVEATDDLQWLRQRAGVLRRVATYMVGLDKDGDGLVETERSGNRGSLVDPDRGETWWDAVAAGNKNAYLNLLVYRALRNVSDLERKLGHADRAEDYGARASALRRTFRKVFFNPDTGWYGWWRARDGEFHDYASLFINGMAIEYGVVDPEPGREVLVRLAHKMDEVGFNRFDLGVPVSLVPIPRDAYLKMANPILGASAKEDGSDCFQHYMNGNTNACFTLPYLAAVHVVGQSERADKILQAMLKRQTEVGFQNGKRQAADAGIEWAAWDGSSSGADGYLADTYQFMQAVMLREPELRAGWYRAVHNQGK